MELVLVKNFPNRLFAEQAQQSLEAEGIYSIVKASDIGIVGPGSIGMAEGVDLYVPQEFVRRASEILDALFDSI